MRERNIWRGGRVPGETRQDSPLRIVNHPPAVDGLRLAVLQDCRNFASLPVTSGALRFNNRRYRNVADFSCKFSCILQVFRRFLTSGPLWAVPRWPDALPVLVAAAAADRLRALVDGGTGRAGRLLSPLPLWAGLGCPPSSVCRLWMVWQAVEVCGLWWVWLVVCGVSWLCLSLSCVILYDTLYNRARN